MYRITKPTSGVRGQRMVWIYKRHKNWTGLVFRGTGPTNEAALRDAVNSVRKWRRAGKP